jgi:hypothetical protein
MTTKGGQNFAWRTKLNEFIDRGQKDTILTRDVFELAASSVLHSNTVLFPWERYPEFRARTIVESVVGYKTFAMSFIASL